MRDRGQGSITPHGDRHRARLPSCYGRRSLGVFDTPEEAAAVLDAALAELDRSPPLTLTLATWGSEWLAELATSPHYKPTSVERERDRWRCYVASSLLGRTPLIDVSEQDVRRWLASLRRKDGKPLAGQTLVNVLSLVRRALDAARQAGRVDSNAAAEVRLPKGARTATGETEWLRAHEIDRVLTCDAISLRSRSIYTVAIFAGLRAGELWGLRWSDVDFDRGVIHVRRSYTRRPKSWQVREVQMLAPVVEALSTWRGLYVSSGVRSRHDLVWPGEDEGCHHEGYDAGWSRHREIVGVAATFHALRHTCASHLLVGTWAPQRPPLSYYLDRPLRLEEVKAWLGHSSIKVTERYSHLEASRLSSVVVRDRDTIGTRPTAAARIRTGDLRFTKPATLVAIRGGSTTDPASCPDPCPDTYALAVRALRAIERGDPRALEMSADALGAVVAAHAADAESEAG